MPDIDDLLDPTISTAASRAARPRDFDALASRGQRRRRVTRAASVAGAVAAAVAVVGGVQLSGGDERTTPRPPVASVPSTQETRAMPDAMLPADDVVTHPDATLAWLAIDPERPEVRASTWRLCLDERCTSERQVLTTTSDGFATATAMDLGSPSTIEAVGGGAFVVIHPEGRSLLRPGDELVPLELDRTRSAVAGDEVLVSWLGPGVQWAAVDPEAATAHAVPLPQGGADQLVQQPDGRLVGTTYYGESGVSWSDDGGATWAQHRLSGVPGLSTYQVLPSLEPSTIAVAEGGDGATLFPYERVHRSIDGGATWDVVDLPEVDGDQARLGWAHVRADGSLVSYISGWSGARANRPSPHPPGPYESAGSDWSQLLPVEPGLPDDLELLDLTRDGIYVGSGAQAYVSADGGRTWEPTPAR